MLGIFGYLGLNSITRFRPLVIILWFNSHIRRQNRPYISQLLYSVNIVRIKDIYLEDENRFMTFRELCKYNYMYLGPFLRYHSLIKAILTQWKELLNQYPFGIPSSMGTQKIRDIVRPSKLTYDDLLSKTYTCVQIPRELWAHELHVEISEERWARLYPTTLRLTKSARLRYFQYRILHKRLTTNVSRNVYKSDISPVCTFCNRAQETVIHLLWECQKASHIWKTFVRWVTHLTIAQCVNIISRYCYFE